MTHQDEDPIEFVSEADQRDALHPGVGDGTPANAPERDPEPSSWTPATTTVGVSPKVRNPAVLGIVVGVVLLATGEKDTGISVLVAALGFGGVGVVSSPGTVRHNDVVDA